MHVGNDLQRIFEQLPSPDLPWYVDRCFISAGGGGGLASSFHSTYEEIQLVKKVRRPTREERYKKRTYNIIEDKCNKQ